MKVHLQKSTRPNKKFRVTLDNGRHVDFGATGYSDYTKHKDTERMRRYVMRHASRENWKRSGIDTPGFWSRWILWSKPSLSSAVKFTANKFKLAISVDRSLVPIIARSTVKRTRI